MIVRWVLTGKTNTISADQVEWEGELKIGTTVCMDWKGTAWYAVVECIIPYTTSSSDILSSASDDTDTHGEEADVSGVHRSFSDSDSESDNMPLSTYVTISTGLSNIHVFIFCH